MGTVTALRRVRNRTRYADHMKYRVQWYAPTSTHNIEDPLCNACFRSLVEAEDFANWLDPMDAYGIEVVPL